MTLPDPGMTDYHCHLLPGLDDGPRNAEQSLEMARALATFGFRRICCTPHCIKGHYEYPPAAVREAVAALQKLLDQAGIPLKLLAGMEYYLDAGFPGVADNLLPLGDSPLILCEAPPRVYPEMVVELLNLIVARGYTPLVAHPERSEVVWALLATAGEGGESPGEADGARTKGAGLSSWFGQQRPVAQRVVIPGSRQLPEEVLFQANLGSFTGYYGPQPQLRAYQLLTRGIYSCLASDLHEACSAEEFLQAAKDKVLANPVLHKLLHSKQVMPPAATGR